MGPLVDRVRDPQAVRLCGPKAVPVRLYCAPMPGTKTTPRR